MALPIILGIAAAAAHFVKTQVDKSENQGVLLMEQEKCEVEASNYKKTREITNFQSKMLKLLLKNSFNEFEQEASPPLSDWEHLDEDIEIHAAKQHSLITWGNYSFYTDDAIYYHNKNKAIHGLLYYDKINNFDTNTGIVDYGTEHEKRNISQWESSDKKFVEQISKLWKTNDENDTSFLEYCFNNCHDFKMDLCYFKTSEIRNAFIKTCKENNFSKILRDFFDNIEIKSMNNRKIELEFWEYFPKDEDYEKAEERQWEAESTLYKLMENKNEISKLFSKSLEKLYGVTFKTENIHFNESPDFTYEGPSVIDKINDTAESAKAFIDDYARKHNINK